MASGPVLPLAVHCSAVRPLPFLEFNRYSWQMEGTALQ
jgi:hypothetical protein